MFSRSQSLSICQGQPMPAVGMLAAWQMLFSALPSMFNHTNSTAAANDRSIKTGRGYEHTNSPGVGKL
jgi:hypothetical protein